MTFIIMTLIITMFSHYAERIYAQCRILRIIMQSVVMVSVVEPALLTIFWPEGPQKKFLQKLMLNDVIKYFLKLFYLYIEKSTWNVYQKLDIIKLRKIDVCVSK
jgi:hypothetical protein